MNKIEKVSDIFARYFIENKKYDLYLEQKVIYFWNNKLFNFGSFSRAYAYKGGNIFILVEHPAYLTEINLKIEEIRKIYKESFGNNFVLDSIIGRITHIRFNEKSKPKERKFGLKERHFVESICAQIKNKRLKSAFENLFETLIKKDIAFKDI